MRSEAGERVQAVGTHRARNLRGRRKLLLLAGLLLTIVAGPSGSDETATGQEALAVPYEIAGERVAPGAQHRFAISGSESFTGAPVPIPILVLHGARPGPTVCLTAGIHGDEINGVEIVRRAIEHVAAARLGGTLLAVPIVNLHGFRRGSRYLPDRRDLNRYFPGRQRGSAASRIAQTVFDRVITRCDLLLDFHTGSFQRDNLPHVRGDLSQHRVLELVAGLSGWLVLDHPGAPGTLRRAAGETRIPAITFEVGGPYRVEPAAITRGLEGVEAVLAGLGLYGEPKPGHPEIVRRSRWVRVDDGGLLFSHAELGDHVDAGDLLGFVVDPISNQRSEIRAPRGGQVIGKAWSQVVIPGFAAFHLALSGETGPLDEPQEVDTALDADDPRAVDTDGIDSAGLDDRPE